VCYTYALKYAREIAPLVAMREVKNGGPNYQTYLQMLATLKPLNQKAREGKRSGPGDRYGVVPIIK